MHKKLNKQYHRRASDLALQLSELKENKYVLLIGSVAEETADESSDIDTVVLYDREPTDENIAEVLNKKSVGKFRFDAHHFHVHHKREDVDMTMLFTPLERMEQFIEKYPDVTFDQYTELSSYIVHGKLLHGDKITFAEWQKKCRAVPAPMKRETIRKSTASMRFWFKEGHLLSLAERGDWVMVNRTINAGVEDALKIIYLLNDRIMIKPKRTRVHLEGFSTKPADIAQRLEDVYLHKNTLADAKNKIDQMASIFDDLKELV